MVGLAFSPDGATLASSSNTNAGNEDKVILWDVATCKEVVTFTRTGSRSVAFAPDGRSIATGDMRGDVMVWDVARFLTPGRGRGGDVRRDPSPGGA